MSAKPRHGGSSQPPKRFPALILVPTGETILVEGKRYRCLRIERESEYGAHERPAKTKGPYPPGKPGRPSKRK